jgi:hypothetical protein
MEQQMPMVSAVIETAAMNVIPRLVEISMGK